LKKWLITLSLVFTTTSFAGQVEIVRVELTKYAETWRADVTLKHADSGWKHYADTWRLVDEYGNEIGKRTLYHPHVNEQPFTRSLSDFHIPESKKIIFAEAHDNKHGWSTQRIQIDMNRPVGEKYQIHYR